MNYTSYRFAPRKKYYSLILIGFAVFSSVSCQFISGNRETPTRSDNFRDGKFYNKSSLEDFDYKDDGFSNPVSGLSKSIGESYDNISRSLFESREGKPSDSIPIQDLSKDFLEALPDDKPSIIRLGHSTVLMKINGEYWLTDPIFSKRAARFQFAGPKRLHKSPISIEELPKIKGVIISHNHYDHLDKNTIQELNSKVERFFVPLRVGDILEKWDIGKQKITELDWWKSKTIGKVKLTATPAQHFSGRGIADSNETLWSSWVIVADNFRIFFSGDSGYFPGFKDIGLKYGPFDLTIMATGGYDENEDEVHNMLPDQVLQAHIDLGGTLLLPVNNSTFDLAFHSWFEPLETITKLGKKRGQIIVTPIMGQTLTLGVSKTIVAATELDWWSDIK